MLKSRAAANSAPVSRNERMPGKRPRVCEMTPWFSRGLLGLIALRPDSCQAGVLNSQPSGPVVALADGNPTMRLSEAQSESRDGDGSGIGPSSEAVWRPQCPLWVRSRPHATTRLCPLGVKSRPDSIRYVAGTRKKGAARSRRPPLNSVVTPAAQYYSSAASPSSELPSSELLSSELLSSASSIASWIKPVASVA